QAGVTFPSGAHGHRVGRLADPGAVLRIPCFRHPPASPERPALERPVRFRAVVPVSFVAPVPLLRVELDDPTVARVVWSHGVCGARLQSGEPECEWSAIDLPARA